MEPWVSHGVWSMTVAGAGMHAVIVSVFMWVVGVMPFPRMICRSFDGLGPQHQDWSVKAMYLLKLSHAR